ncbi:MAG TPA: alpha-L-fucosidase [Candidatus Hydrogenedentes bacterium]|nr:alpha-L-fucosidase [Candidatus Hydrogenedentota bacterium]
MNSAVLAVMGCVTILGQATDAAPETGARQGVTLYVSKLGNNTDGLSWETAFNTIQAALSAVPDDKGGHRIIVRPDTYMEAMLSPAFSGAAGAYNELIGDADGTLGSGTSGHVVIDSGDPGAGFKSYDWWSTIRATSQGWSPEHTDPTFSAIIWDRWVLRNLYATGSDAGLFWDCTNRIEPFTIVVEDCVGIGRAFGGGVASCLSRPDEPIVFRRCNLWSLDMWGDTAGGYVRIENPSMPERADVVFEDCTLVSPQCALKGGNYGFHTYMRIKVERCRLVALNFSQPVGTPTDGIIQSVQNGKYLHVDMTDTTLMGYKVFGVKVDKDSEGAIGYTAKGAVQAYVQFQQGMPKGVHRLQQWPVDVFQAIAPPPPLSSKPMMMSVETVVENMCELSPVIWNGRLCHMECVRPGSGGVKEDYYLLVKDAETGDILAKFAEGYSLASAFVHEGIFYAFASRFENDTWNDVTMFKSRDLANWESKVVITQENENLFNSSVCEGPGGFVMAYESNEPAYPAFTTKFARSKDLETWTKLPDSTFGTNRYTACPCVRFVNGFYYVLYLENRRPRHYFETYVTRSKDLEHWELSAANPVLAPKTLDESINTSDPDIIELDGKTYLYYSAGDQLTWMNIKRGMYPCSMQKLFEGWFATPGIPDWGSILNHRARVEKEQAAAAQKAAEDEARAARVQWFRDAKFGMFVHWGPFAVHSSDPNATYDYFDMKTDREARADFKKYAQQFNSKSFDAAEWMETAKNAGAKYVVFTSKHHDGYTMFDSALTDYDSADYPPKADYVRQLVDAARAAGLKIGFYYSILDWDQPSYTADLPAFVNDYLFGQVRELCTNYGPIDCVWFDGEWDHPASTWRAPELTAMIRELQPAALINDRLGLGERGVTRLCDFYTREQPSEVNVAMGFEREKPFPWEACVTIGDYWQFSIKDTRFKSPQELVRVLVDVVSRGGNLLLNVGPTPDGVIPDALTERLMAIGAWLEVNGEGIYGTSGSPFGPLPAGEGGAAPKCTTKGARLYVHLESRPGDRLALPGLQNGIISARFLRTGAAVEFDNAAKTITLPKDLPDDIMTTIEIELDGEPRIE